MKILITTGIFKPELGGPATYAVELGRRLQAAGHPIKVITYSDKPAYSFDKEFPFSLVRVVRSSNKLINYLKYFSVVIKHARKYDLIYSLDWFSAGVPVMLASFFTGKKYIVRVGGGYIWEKYLAQGKPPVTLKEFYKNKLYKEYKIMYYAIKLVLRRASKVVFNSDEQRELYKTYYGLHSDKIVTITNPVPENKFGTLLRSFKQEDMYADKEIVYAGRFIKMKNVESVIKAFAKLRDGSFTLLLIGEGPTEAELRKLVKENGLSERVTFLPVLPLVELYRRISNCYYVITASWTDISPMQIYECLALGIPFLLTKENYLTINKFDFIKIDPTSIDDIAEKMNMLLDPEIYRKHRESLSRLSYHYSWNNVVVDHMRLFTHI